MEQHESNGHGNSHDDHATEGNRQYYPKGWWVPLIGLVTVALGFTLLGGFIFGISGTDKWGKSNQCQTCENGKCDSAKCMDEKKCDGKCVKDKDGNVMMNVDAQKNDSAMTKTDDGKKDSTVAKMNDLQKQTESKPEHHKHHK